MAISSRLVVVASCAIVLVALAGSWSAFWLVSTITALLVVVDWLLAANLAVVEVSRRGAVTARLDEAVRVDITVTNHGHRAVRGVIRDAWPPSAGATPNRQALTLPAGERRVLASTLLATRRGRRTADAVTVRAFGPLRLIARQRRFQSPWSIDVLPPFRSRKHLPSRLARLRDLDGRTAVLIRGQGSEFDSLREYVDGDDVRSIDWRASARASDVMVRTWRPERDRRVLLVVDTGRTAAGRVGDAPRLDAQIEAALLLGALATRAGDRVEVIAWDRSLRASVRGESGAALLATLTRALAPVEASLVETDWRGLVAEVLRRERRRCLVVVLTALETAPLTEGLVPLLPLFTQRHQVVIAGVLDPEVAVMARGRDDVRAVYQAAAAERANTDRRSLAEVLQHHSVSVVAALPDDIAPAVADHYLALKAAGRL